MAFGQRAHGEGLRVAVGRQHECWTHGRGIQSARVQRVRDRRRAGTATIPRPAAGTPSARPRGGIVVGHRDLERLELLSAVHCPCRATTSSRWVATTAPASSPAAVDPPDRPLGTGVGGDVELTMWCRRRGVLHEGVSPAASRRRERHRSRNARRKIDAGHGAPPASTCGAPDGGRCEDHARRLSERRPRHATVAADHLQLSTACAPRQPSGKLRPLRHRRETAWSKAESSTGLTDILLVPPTARIHLAGPAPSSTGYDFRPILSSPLQRPGRTAELAGLDADIDPLMVEWDYGGYEGRTTREIPAVSWATTGARSRTA